ncbi:DEAD/DEAH box helicase [Mariniflexile ostreae]|uniref:DEAD/DEAH box helicase n=1 Tax=Mariniflexile ostreae TaxID=1520892 RepID=A0ABV5F9C6_9FLAO
MDVVFKEIIKKWSTHDHKDKSYNEKQLTNLLYKQKIELELVEHALQEYDMYFERVKRYLFFPKWNLLMRDFPSWFDIVENKMEGLEKAFIDEAHAIEDDNAKLWIMAKVKRSIKNSNYGFLYEAVISLPDGISTPSQEGIPINLWWKDVPQNNNVRGVYLAYYRRQSTMIFRLSHELSEAHLNTVFRFKPKPIDFLKGVKNRFKASYMMPSNLTHKLFYKTDFLEYSSNKINTEDSRLNLSQNEAVNRVFNQNITFIWGPPGTGKTYTLAKLITKACCQGLSVLAVGISNASIDVLGLEIIREFDNYSASSKKIINERKLLRFGYPVLPEIVNDNRLYPDKALVDHLRKDYATVLKVLRNDHGLSLEEKAMARNKQFILKNEIKQINQKRIREATLVFTTAAQCFIGDDFGNKTYDLVVIDEVGMMPLIQTLTMAGFSNDKLVVAGDYKQLGPISMGRTEAVDNWFNKDVFEYFKDVAGFEENMTVMLTEQRRMHPEICDLVNTRFYSGKLTTCYTSDFEEIGLFNHTLATPYCFIPVGPKEGSVVRSTEGRSRVNARTSQIVSDIVEHILINNTNINIGVITPYNGQVTQIRRLLNSKRLSKEQLHRVKTGTIHAFQGSGFDMIIYDIVDNSEKNIGMLYKGFQGERLLNVALSRAKHKLIIVGDPKVFSMTDDLQEVSKKLRSFMVELRMSAYQLGIESMPR